MRMKFDKFYENLTGSGQEERHYDLSKGNSTSMKNLSSGIEKTSSLSQVRTINSSVQEGSQSETHDVESQINSSHIELRPAP